MRRAASRSMATMSASYLMMLVIAAEVVQLRSASTAAAAASRSSGVDSIFNTAHRFRAHQARALRRLSQARAFNGTSPSAAAATATSGLTEPDSSAAALSVTAAAATTSPFIPARSRPDISSSTNSSSTSTLLSSNSSSRPLSQSSSAVGSEEPNSSTQETPAPTAPNHLQPTNSSSSNSSRTPPSPTTPSAAVSNSSGQDTSFQEATTTRDSTNYCVQPIKMATNVPAVGPTDKVGYAVSAGLSCATRPKPLNTLGGRCKITCDNPEDLGKVIITEVNIMAAPAVLFTSDSGGASDGNSSTAQARSAAGQPLQNARRAAAERPGSSSPTITSSSTITAGDEPAVSRVISNPVHCEMTVTAAPLAAECRLEVYVMCC